MTISLPLGGPMVPRGSRNFLEYDAVLYLGTFEQAGKTILFWLADSYDDSDLRYVYVELTSDEAANVELFFRHSTENLKAYDGHPLLSGRRVTVGRSDAAGTLAEVSVIECTTDRVFDEVQRLFRAR